MSEGPEQPPGSREDSTAERLAREGEKATQTLEEIRRNIEALNISSLSEELGKSSLEFSVRVTQALSSASIISVAMYAEKPSIAFMAAIVVIGTELVKTLSDGKTIGRIRENTNRINALLLTKRESS